MTTWSARGAGGALAVGAPLPDAAAVHKGGRRGCRGRAAAARTHGARRAPRRRRRVSPVAPPKVAVGAASPELRGRPAPAPARVTARAHKRLPRRWRGKRQAAAPRLHRLGRPGGALVRLPRRSPACPVSRTRPRRLPFKGDRTWRGRRRMAACCRQRRRHPADHAAEGPVDSPHSPTAAVAPMSVCWVDHWSRGTRGESPSTHSRRRPTRPLPTAADVATRRIATVKGGPGDTRAAEVGRCPPQITVAVRPGGGRDRPPPRAGAGRRVAPRGTAAPANAGAATGVGGWCVGDGAARWIHSAPPPAAAQRGQPLASGDLHPSDKKDTWGRELDRPHP